MKVWLIQLSQLLQQESSTAQQFGKHLSSLLLVDHISLSATCGGTICHLRHAGPDHGVANEQCQT
jgi:hypothetical protein